MIGIIETGNSGSVKNALNYLGIPFTTNLDRATKIILPGQGSFGN